MLDIDAEMQMRCPRGRAVPVVEMSASPWLSDAGPGGVCLLVARMTLDERQAPPVARVSDALE